MSASLRAHAQRVQAALQAEAVQVLWTLLDFCLSPQQLCLPMQTKLEAARSKAEAISGNEDMAAGSKAREIEKLYAKARASGKGKDKKGKPSRSAQYKNKGKPLDPRLRKDKRQVNFKAKAKAAKKKQKGKGKGPARKIK